MRRPLLLATLLLSGCVVNSIGPFGREVPAPPDALACATREIGRLGYTLDAGSTESRLVHGEKTLFTHTPRTRARLTAIQVEGTVHETRLRVSAERWEERTGAAPRGPGASPGGGVLPPPMPGVPVPGARDTAYARSRRPAGWRRVSPGPAAADARQVLRTCAYAGSAD